MNRVKKYFMLFCLVLAISCVGVTSSVAATLTASTTLTVVDVKEFRWGSVDITQWEGDWPNDPTDNLPPKGAPLYEHYLYNVHFTANHMSWSTLPTPTSYWTFYNGVNSMVAAVWSENNGQSFILGSWDYLASHSTGKGIEAGMPNCWMGTMVHALCDRKAGECNGRFKSNLYFTEYPSGAAGCWGTM